jgi:hypothetical protein
VNNASGNPCPEGLQRHADIDRQIAVACLSHLACTAIQTWGFYKYQRLRNAPESGKQPLVVGR